MVGNIEGILIIIQFEKVENLLKLKEKLGVSIG
jgi:hypothetical protein